MRRARFWLAAAGLGGVLLCTSFSPSQTQTRVAATYKMEPVAETRLIMEGITKPNFDGLTKLLKQQPTEADSWTFARGQALVVAETGNLLMLRPPKTKAAQDVWLARAAEVREAGVKVARAAGTKNYAEARVALTEMVNACNRCHSGFAVKTRLTVADEGDK
ncbi:hypothetical protein [Fimbriiglobus ruber]|uniref:Cytochrome c n=1 Tax=Fimbriiglobus ruber TaxID=1908690 RepID=A0A225DPW0_9BACT|nr:hypothetical protein [Fimbriiglobus ruber]OWK41674.1 hypothetical protein FRUB_03752 [Fimbriiglobus ruber]